MTPRRTAPPPVSPFARPDGSCLGRHPEEEDEEPVPAAPADPEDAPVQPTEPMNPA
ncbi:hypothetical protein [Azospirillum soli]|uniref:hypothetical protein n=1 Tax=Azospirillum soli TaxID=1304799 RepID=UPI001AEA7FCF|nr:hypothetical protein [Azospirillum soli]MBP2314846.1 hypothetical protein [Azospirillum soli]